MRARRLVTSAAVVALDSAPSSPRRSARASARRVGGAVVDVGDVVGALLQRPDVAELAQPRQRIVEAAGRHAQDERRGRVPVAGGDLRGLHEASGRLRGPHDAVAGRLHVGGGQLEARAALDAPLLGGRHRARGRSRELRAAGGRARAAPARAAAASAAALRGVGGLVLDGRPPGGAAAGVNAVVARDEHDGQGGGQQAAGHAEGRHERATPRAGPARRLGEAVRHPVIQARPEVGRHRGRLGAHVAHERGEVGLGGGIAGKGGLERRQLGGYGGIEGGLMTAHDRPPEVGRGRGARECPRWRPRRRGRRRSRRCSVPRGTSGR